MFRQSTVAESEIPFQTFYTINANTGLISFNPPGASIGDQFALSVAVLEKDSGGTQIGRVTVDFIVRVSNIANNDPPAFVDPTPVDATFVRAADGSTIEFDVKCTDPNGDKVTLNALNLPLGATFPNGIMGTPMATGTFSWTPTSTGVAAIAFTCTDSKGGAALPTTITIEVLPVCETNGVGTATGPLNFLLGLIPHVSVAYGGTDEPCLPEGTVIGLVNACDMFASVGVGRGSNNPTNIQGAIGKIGPGISGFNLVGNPTMDGYGMPGLGFDTAGDLYGATAIPGDTPGMLILIDKNTGALIEDIGVFTEFPGTEGETPHKIADLTVSPENQMYGLKRDPPNGDLYKIDTSTAEVTFAGNVASAGEKIRGLTFLKDGRLVATITSPNNELIEILLDANGDVTGTQKLRDLSTNFNGLGACPSGLLVGTHIENSHEIYIIDPDSGALEELIGLGLFDLSDLDAPIFVPVVPPTGNTGNSGHEPPTIGKSLDGVRQVVDGGIAVDGQTWTVTQGYHQEFELLQMLTSPHTISNVIHCDKGVQYCNYIAVGFMGLTDDFNNPVMTVSASKDHQGTWTIDWYDPDNYIADPGDAAPKDIVFVPQIIDNRLLGTSFTIDFNNKDTGQLKMGIQVRDSYNGVRNFYFNEGVEFVDADAYPSVEGAYDAPVEVEPVCFGQNNPDRNSCQFDKMQEWATANAEETLRQMTNNQYEYDQ